MEKASTLVMAVRLRRMNWLRRAYVVIKKHFYKQHQLKREEVGNSASAIVSRWWRFSKQFAHRQQRKKTLKVKDLVYPFFSFAVFTLASFFSVSPFENLQITRSRSHVWVSTLFFLYCIKKRNLHLMSASPPSDSPLTLQPPPSAPPILNEILS